MSRVGVASSGAAGRPVGGRVGTGAGAGLAGAPASKAAADAPSASAYPSALSPAPLLLSSIGTLALPPSLMPAAPARAQQKDEPQGESSTAADAADETGDSVSAPARTLAADGSTDAAALTRLLHLLRHLSSLALAAPAAYSCAESLAARADDAQHFAGVAGGPSVPSGQAAPAAPAGPGAAGRAARWAPVTKARLGSGLRVERTDDGRCSLVLYKEPLQARASHPSISVRPHVRSELFAPTRSRRRRRPRTDAALLDALSGPSASSGGDGAHVQDGVHDAEHEFDGDAWADAVEALGWRFRVHHVRRGLRFVLAVPASGGAGAGASRGHAWHAEVTLFRLFKDRAPRTRSSAVRGRGAPPDATKIEPDAGADTVMQDASADAATSADPQGPPPPNNDAGAEIAPGTVFVQLRVTLPVDALAQHGASGPMGASGGGGAGPGAGSDDVLERAKEWTAEVISGLKPYIVLEKDE